MRPVSVNATVLVIGASRGQGYAIAAEHVDRSSHVVATVRGSGRAALHEHRDTADGRLQHRRLVSNPGWP
jgi:NAD(P)-dependent dehydrogenase (short-subunit alcohol dehydrogenase family)